MKLRLIATLVLFSTALWISSASAQDAETITKVEAHFGNGATFFQKGEYDKAIHEFEAGYALYPDPILLYNISLAHGKLGRINKSLAVAELAEATKLQDPDRTQNLSRISALRQAQNATSVAPQIAKVAEEEERAALAKKKQREEDEKGLGTLGWIGIGTASAGGLALIGAIVVDAGVGSDIEAYENAAERGDQAEYDRLKSEIDSKQTTAQVLLFTGIGLTAVGGGLIVYDLYFDNASDTSISVMPTAGGFSASYFTRF